MTAAEPSPKDRLDKWLWHARFFKTRTLAAKQVQAGHIRVNGTRITKASASVTPGDTLSFAIGTQVRIIEITAIPTRRGPAAEAQTHYIDHSPEHEKPKPRTGPRPTGKARRQWDAAQSEQLE